LDVVPTCIGVEKFGKKYFSGNFYGTFGHFRAKIMQNLGILLTFRANIIKIWVFCYIFGQDSGKIQAFC